MLNFLQLHFRIVCYYCHSKRKEIQLVNTKIISLCFGLCKSFLFMAVPNTRPLCLYLATCLIETVSVVNYLAICEISF